MMLNNILKYDYCYGCGVCVGSCPRNIISIRLNKSGFYEPYIVNIDGCVECGVCLDVCSFAHSEVAQKFEPVKSWAAWSNDARVRSECSSGGVGFEIGRQLIENGYKAIGCRYDVKKQRAEHYIATTIDEFIPSIGSKYIQSFTGLAFRQIDRKQKNLVIGTPCQIDSFRRMIQKFHCENNFILMDFFCHCVPSMWAWDSYRKMLERKIGEVTYASWRNKFEYGWHDSWLMGIDGAKISGGVNGNDLFNHDISRKKPFIQSRKSQGDLFYKLFLGDVCLGPQCENDCKFKYNQSAADIRIGDLWGATYKNNQEGVSALIAFTEKGLTVVNTLKNVTLINHPFEVVAEGQMKKNARHKELTPIVMWLLRNGSPLTGILFKITLFLQRVITKTKRIVQR